MGAKVHNVAANASSSANFRKKRKMSATQDSDGALANMPPSPPAPSTTMSRNVGHAAVNSTSESARRRWRLLQKHVCITRWLSKDLLQRHLKRFALSQQAVVDAVMASKDDFMEVVVKIRVRLLSGVCLLAVRHDCLSMGLTCALPLVTHMRRSNSSRSSTPSTASSCLKRSDRCSSSTAARSTRLCVRSAGCCTTPCVRASRFISRAQRCASARALATASRTSLTSAYVFRLLSLALLH